MEMIAGHRRYQVRRMRLSQQNIWARADGSPVVEIAGETEELFVLGTGLSGSSGGAEQFVPNRYEGKIGDVYRNEGIAQHVCRIFAIPARRSIWHRASRGNPYCSALLAEVIANSFQPWLDKAMQQARSEGYERALAEMVRAARASGEWHTGISGPCSREGDFVLIGDHRAPRAAPPLVRISLAHLAKLALLEEMGLHFLPGDYLFLDHPWVIPVEAMSAEGTGLAYLPDPLVTSTDTFIPVHVSAKGQRKVRRLLKPSWGMDAPEQAQALIGRIAAMHDWTRPARSLFDGLDSEELEALGERVRQSCREVGGNEHGMTARSRTPARGGSKHNQARDTSRVLFLVLVGSPPDAASRGGAE